MLSGCYWYAHLFISVILCSRISIENHYRTHQTGWECWERFCWHGVNRHVTGKWSFMEPHHKKCMHKHWYWTEREKKMTTKSPWIVILSGILMYFQIRIVFFLILFFLQLAMVSLTRWYTWHLCFILFYFISNANRVVYIRNERLQFKWK